MADCKEFIKLLMKNSALRYRLRSRWPSKKKTLFWRACVACRNRVCPASSFWPKYLRRRHP